MALVTGVCSLTVQLDAAVRLAQGVARHAAVGLDVGGGGGRDVQPHVGDVVLHHAGGAQPRPRGHGLTRAPHPVVDGGRESLALTAEADVGAELDGLQLAGHSHHRGNCGRVRVRWGSSTLSRALHCTLRSTRLLTEGGTPLLAMHM